MACVQATIEALNESTRALASLESFAEKRSN